MNPLAKDLKEPSALCFIFHSWSEYRIPLTMAECSFSLAQMSVGTISICSCVNVNLKEKVAVVNWQAKVEGLLGFSKSLKFKLCLKSHCGEVKTFIISLLSKGWLPQFFSVTQGKFM